MSVATSWYTSLAQLLLSQLLSSQFLLTHVLLSQLRWV